MNQNITGNELQLYKSFYTTYPDAILVLQQGVIILCNELAQLLFQVEDEQELINKTLSDFALSNAQSEVESLELENHLNKCLLEGKDVFEWTFLNKKNIKTHVKIFLSKILIDDKKLVQVILRNNDRVENDNAKNQEQELKAITEALDQSAIISIADTQGKIIKVNEEFCRISQYSEQELLGQDHRIVNSAYHPKEFWQKMWQTITRGKTWRADVKNKAKDGSFYWVDTVINPILNTNKKITSYLSIRYLITDRKEQENQIQANQEQLQATEEELRQNLEELETQRDYIQEINKQIKTKSEVLERNSQALLNINKNKDIYAGNLEVAFELITKLVAQTLNIERVGIWRYDTINEVKIICQKQYETTENGYIFTQGAQITQNDTPKYFADIITEKNIVADFAQNHPALVEFIDSYLIPLEIKSMLDIPYFIDGKLAGVICCEAQHKYRNWTDEDIAFVKGISDSITITIKTQQQLKEQEKVRKNVEELQTTQKALLATQLEQEKFVSIIKNVDAFVAIADLKGKIEFLNEKGKVLSGFKEDYKGRLISDFHTEESAIIAKEVIIPTVMQKGVWRGEHRLQNHLTKQPIDTLANIFIIRDPNTQQPIALATVQLDITAQKDLERAIQDQNQRLQASEEELRQNMEELQATQEAMEQKQKLVEESKITLEKQNAKLVHNEAILKKAFDKMKLQESQLKDSFASLQAQEEELRQNMEELETTQDRVNSAFAELDAQFNAINSAFGYIELATNRKVTRVNSLLAEWFEYEIDELQDKSHIDLIPTTQEDKEQYNELWQTLERGETYIGVFKRKTKSGNDLWLFGAYCPIKNEAGQVVRIIKIASNYNLQKATEIEAQTRQEELLATEEELRQNMEELQATQEAMREKQVLIEDSKAALEKHNQKLVANESVLKKTFEKMKVQEDQLKDSLGSLQAQEEELRQNMEELEATQEAMAQKQKLVEEAKISLEKQNEKLASNEAVLKKAFQKMKTQDLKLRESFDALQTQEEELRQNMEELQTTQEVLAYQKDILEISNRQITKSISYAETIQKAILPSKKLIKETLPESFIIYKPKDIVSGDFYWLSRHENKTLVGVIDCTGHGVPGAFMSLVASNILSEIINQKGILQPNIILQELHKGVVKKLNQKEGANNDGMDLTLCLLEEISNNQTQLTFGGVKQNLYIVRDKELIELRGNRRSIGGGKRDDEREYTQESIVLQRNDAVFLATDGYPDQANEDRKSFSKKSFRELMLEVAHLSAKEQMKIFETRLANHQKATEQRDDITVFGFKV
ncbi:PAS domain S-box protein [Bernardetia sp. MNP-M8]|uniref:PAS domain S-box protein n=1 Tax=Bernardetia sp. MNP-M8 TaxID=3127470 RepID=UPI0030D605ED